MRGFRIFALGQIETLSAKQLNNVSAGFNNNIIWNLCHLIAAQQNMCYARSGLPFAVDANIVSTYLSGTRPGLPVEEKEIATLKSIFISSIDRLQTDYEAKLFTNYSPSVMIPKVYGFEVKTIEQALEYLLFHEGYHSGVISSLMKLQ